MNLHELVRTGFEKLGPNAPEAILADAALRYNSTSAHNARAQDLAEEILLGALMDRERALPETAQKAADAGESIDEYLCRTFIGHSFPAWEELGESARCLCARCGADGDA